MFSIKRLFQTKSAAPERAGAKPYFYSDLRNAEDKAAYIRSLDYSAMSSDEFRSLGMSLMSNDSRTNLGTEVANQLINEILLSVQPSPAEAEKFRRRSEDFGNALLEDDDVRHYLQSSPGEATPDPAALQPIAAKIVEAYGAIFDVKTLPLVKIIDETMRGWAFSAHGGDHMRITADQNPRVFLSRIMAACVDTQYDFSSDKPDAHAAAIELARRHDDDMNVSTPSEFADYMSTPFVDRVMTLTAGACEKLSVPPPELAQELWDYRMTLNLYKDKFLSLENIENSVTEMNGAPSPINVQGHLYLRNLKRILPDQMQDGYKKWRDYFDPDNREVPPISVAGDVDPHTGEDFSQTIRNTWLFHVPPAMRELLTQSSKPLNIEICRFKIKDVENSSGEEKVPANTRTAGDYDKYLNKIRIFTHTVKEGIEYPIDKDSVSHIFLHEAGHGAAKVFYGMTTNENSGLKKNYIKDINSIDEKEFGEFKDIISYNLPKSHGGDHESVDVACEEAFCDSVAGKLGFGTGHIETIFLLDRLLPSLQTSVETFIAGIHVIGELGLKRDDITYGGRISRESSGFTAYQLEQDKAQAAQRIEFAMMGGPIFFG